MTETTTTPDSRILDLRVTTGDGGQTFGVTGDHPFWTEGGGWTEAADLEAGDRVSTAAGGWRRVVGASWRATRRTVYNLEVRRAHTYFVGDPAVWVHNRCDWVGDNVTVKGKKTGRLSGYTEAVSETTGGMKKAVNKFKSLAGERPKIPDPSSKAPVDTVRAGDRVFRFRPSSSSGGPVIQVVDHGNETGAVLSLIMPHNWGLV